MIVIVFDKKLCAVEKFLGRLSVSYIATAFYDLSRACPMGLRLERYAAPAEVNDYFNLHEFKAQTYQS